MNDLDEDVTEEMARDAARLWKSCTSGDAIGEGEFTELECLTDECSSTGSQCPFGRGSARLLRLLRARLVLLAARILLGGEPAHRAPSHSTVSGA